MANKGASGRRYRSDIPGLVIRPTSKGFTVIELDYIADPVKRNPKWAEKERPKYTKQAWMREMERDWTSGKGSVFYPEFQLDKARFIRRIQGMLPSPLIRGWDFGVRHPACIWLQVAPSGRVGVLREFMPFDIEVHEFRDAVKYLSGQVPLKYLVEHRRKRALQIISDIENGAKWVPRAWPQELPWFKKVHRFIDFGGHEARARKTIEGEKRERNDAQVLQAGGINISTLAVRKDAREYVLRRLMSDWPDGWPGLILDPACAILIEGLAGGIVYPQPTKLIPEPSNPKVDGYYEHLHDAVGYGVASSVKITEDNEVKPKYRWEGRVLVEEQTGKMSFSLPRGSIR